MSLKEINEEIGRLQKERQAVLDEEYKKLEEEFLKLDWIRETTLYFEDRGYVGAGMCQYTLRGNHSLAKKVLSDLGKYIELVKGDVYYNGLHIHNWGYYSNFDFEIGTNNENLLCKFIEDNGLKIGSGDKKRYRSKAALYTTLHNYAVYNG